MQTNPWPRWDRSRLRLSGHFSKPAFIILTSALLVPFLYLCETSVPRHRPSEPTRTNLCVGIGGALLVYPWSDFASQGHIDDILVLFGCALVVRAVMNASPLQAGLGFALAVAGKPTAILFAPVLLPAGLTAIAVAVAATAVIWMPFFLADPGGFLTAGKGVIEVQTRLLSLLSWVRALGTNAAVDPAASPGRWCFAVLPLRPQG